MRKVGSLVLVVWLAACGGDDDGGGGDGTTAPGPFDEVPLGETVAADGLSAPVDVVRDEYGVAHVYAKTIDDLAI